VKVRIFSALAHVPRHRDPASTLSINQHSFLH